LYVAEVLLAINNKKFILETISADLLIDFYIVNTSMRHLITVQWPGVNHNVSTLDIVILFSWSGRSEGYLEVKSYFT
jgi:hypothetical protein